MYLSIWDKVIKLSASYLLPHARSQLVPTRWETSEMKGISGFNGFTLTWLISYSLFFHLDVDIRLFTFCHGHFAYPNMEPWRKDAGLFRTDYWATRCYCLIVSSTGNTQELSVSADKGIACLLWKKHPFNNGWSRADSFDPADHFTLLTLPLCLCARWSGSSCSKMYVQYIKGRQQTNSP